MQLEVTARNPEVFLFTNLQGTGYVENDPVNFNDPSGLNRAAPYCYWVDDNIGSEGGGFYFLREYWSYLVCEDWGWGGSTLEAPEEEQDSIRSLSQVPRQLKTAISELTGDCVRYAENLRSKAADLVFYDMRDRQTQARSVGSILGNGDPTPLSSVTHFGEFAGILIGQGENGEKKVHPHVLLRANFWSDTFAGQKLTLLHELFHYTAQSVGELVGSLTIDEWIEKGCPPQPRPRRIGRR